MLRRLLKKNIHQWAGAYVKRQVRQRLQRQQPRGTRHLLFAFCDHYEPLWGNAPMSVGLERVRYWHEEYPKLASAFVDADGRAPQHSFFFPGEEYAPAFLDRLSDLCARGFGEVELHLHHDRDSADSLRQKIAVYLEQLGKHGHFTRDANGRSRYAFIHGNWCLANARADGRWCGVDDELPLLFATGCYADYTFPSAPDECQPGIVNQLYWPMGDLDRRRAYDRGEEARVGQKYDDRILMVTGPLALVRRPGSLKPRIESAAITDNDPPTAARVRSWVRQQITIAGRPEWVFVKVHTHGAPESQARAILGAAGRELHETLAREFNDGHDWMLHYVTARELFNIARAAMDGHVGNPNAYRDYVLPPPPVRSAPRTS